MCEIIRFFILMTVSLLVASSAPITEQEALNKLRSLGMTEYGVNMLIKLDEEFKNEYPKVAAYKDAAYQFIDDFAIKAQNVVDAMLPQDQEVYNTYVRRSKMQRKPQNVF